MNYAFRMREAHRIADFEEDIDEMHEWESLNDLPVPLSDAAEDVLEGAALDELPCVEDVSGSVDAELMDGHDIGVLELSGNLCFLDEAKHHALFHFFFREHDLHGDRTPDVQVHCLENRTHPTASDHLADLVFLAIFRFDDLG